MHLPRAGTKQILMQLYSRNQGGMGVDFRDTNGWFWLLCLRLSMMFMMAETIEALTFIRGIKLAAETSFNAIIEGD